MPRSQASMSGKPLGALSLEVSDRNKYLAVVRS